MSVLYRGVSDGMVWYGNFISGSVYMNFGLLFRPSELSVILTCPYYRGACKERSYRIWFHSCLGLDEQASSIFNSFITGCNFIKIINLKF